jgi:hypothetical protein
MIKAQMMKSHLSFTVGGLILATVALGFTAVSQLPSFTFREAVMVRITAVNGPLSNRFYCDNGGNGQYSGMHRGWVCPTEPAPAVTN